MKQSRKRIILAVACGVIAALSMALYASSVRAEATQAREAALAKYGGERVEVYAANRDIAVGEALSKENVSKQTWLSDLLPAGALSSQDDVLGQTAVAPLMKNEPVVGAKLGILKAPINVPTGFCAVSIPTDEVLAVGGAIRAGNYVTVYATDGTVVELIAEEVLILETSTGATLAAKPSEGSGIFGGSSLRTSLTWVTLAVEPDTAQELIAAARSGQLHLVLPGGETDD